MNLLCSKKRKKNDRSSCSQNDVDITLFDWKLQSKCEHTFLQNFRQVKIYLAFIDRNLKIGKIWFVSL